MTGSTPALARTAEHAGHGLGGGAMFWAHPSLPFIGLSVIADATGMAGGLSFGQDLALASIPAAAGVISAVFIAVRSERGRIRRKHGTSDADEGKYLAALEEDRAADRRRIEILEKALGDANRALAKRRLP